MIPKYDKTVDKKLAQSFTHMITNSILSLYNVTEAWWEDIEKLHSPLSKEDFIKTTYNAYMNLMLPDGIIENSQQGNLAFYTTYDNIDVFQRLFKKEELHPHTLYTIKPVIMELIKSKESEGKCHPKCSIKLEILDSKYNNTPDTSISIKNYLDSTMLSHLTNDEITLLMTPHDSRLSTVAINAMLMAKNVEILSKLIVNSFMAQIYGPVESELHPDGINLEVADAVRISTAVSFMLYSFSDIELATICDDRGEKCYSIYTGVTHINSLQTPNKTGTERPVMALGISPGTIWLE